MSKTAHSIYVFYTNFTVGARRRGKNSFIFHKLYLPFFDDFSLEPYGLSREKALSEEEKSDILSYS